MEKSKYDKFCVIFELIKKVETLKNNLHCKIPCNNNEKYDFTDLENLVAKISIDGDLINDKNKKFSVSIKFINDQWEKMMDSYINTLKKNLEDI